MATNTFTPDTPTWQPDFTVNYDAVADDWKGSQSFVCKWEQVKDNIPSKDDPCQVAGFTFMTFRNCTIKMDKGKMATVSCNYVGSNNESTSEHPETLDGWVGQTRIGYDEMDLETHPYFAGDPFVYNDAGGNWKYVSAWRQGLLTYIDTIDGADRYWYYGGEVATIVTIEHEKIQMLLKAIREGKQSYFQNKLVYTCRKSGFREILSEYVDTKVGKVVAQPPGNPIELGSGEWIYMGGSLDFDGVLYTAELEYWGYTNPIPDDIKEILGEE